MWSRRLQVNVAKVILDVWTNQGQPMTVAAYDVLERYRQEIGELTPKVLDEALAIMEDDGGPMPFLRVNIQNTGGEMRGLHLTDVDPKRLSTLASELKP